MDPQSYSVALKPDAVFYLRLGVNELIPRVIFSRGFDPWESGMDLHPAYDMYESFCSYQKALLAEFDRLSSEYRFETVDASPDANLVFSLLKVRVLEILECGCLKVASLQTFRGTSRQASRFRRS